MRTRQPRKEADAGERLSALRVGKEADNVIKTWPPGEADADKRTNH